MMRANECCVVHTCTCFLLHAEGFQRIRTPLFPALSSQTQSASTGTPLAFGATAGGQLLRTQFTKLFVLLNAGHDAKC